MNNILAINNCPAIRPIHTIPLSHEWPNILVLPNIDFTPVLDPFLTQLDSAWLEVDELFMIYFVTMAHTMIYNGDFGSLSTFLWNRCNLFDTNVHTWRQKWLKMAWMQPNVPFPNISIHIANNQYARDEVIGNNNTQLGLLSYCPIWAFAVLIPTLMGR